jgi:hypothetical protein
MLRILHAEAGRNLEHGSSLIREYASSLDFGLGFQDFEEELAHFLVTTARPRDACWSPSAGVNLLDVLPSGNCVKAYAR